MALIELSGVGKRFRIGDIPVDALCGISLGIERDETVAVMGPSGSGKSTLLGILGALDVPTIGSYRLDGLDVATLSNVDLANLRCRKIGFVFQGFNLLPRLTALENVELALAYGEVPPRERRESAKALLAQVGLADRMAHVPSQLSGGQQQRVSIARALANAPDLILADEPTGALDTKTGDEILDLLLTFRSAGKAVVVVTHDASVARRMGRVINLRDGLIEQDRTYPASTLRSNIAVIRGPE